MIHFYGRQPLMEDDMQWRTTFNGRQHSMEDDIQWKTTFDGRRPSMKDILWWRTTFNGGQPSMEDDIQWKMTFDWRLPLMEDDLHWRNFEIPLCHLPPLWSFFFYSLPLTFLSCRDNSPPLDKRNKLSMASHLPPTLRCLM